MQLLCTCGGVVIADVLFSRRKLKKHGIATITELFFFIVAWQNVRFFLHFAKLHRFYYVYKHIGSYEEQEHLRFQKAYEKRRNFINLN